MGIVRLLLALYVIHFHVYHAGGGGIVAFNFLPDLSGREAVQLFFLISGFYMALVLNRKYFGVGSTRLFFSNRFFRLWPSYFVITVLIVFWFLASGQVYLFNWQTSTTDFLNTLRDLDLWEMSYVFLTNVFVFGQDYLWFVTFDDTGGIEFGPFLVSGSHNGSSFSLNHPIFTVAIETTYYLASPFLLRRSFLVPFSFFIIGGMYHIALWYTGNYHVIWSYHFFPSAAYFYFLGACAYHLYSGLERRGLGQQPARYLRNIELVVYAGSLIAGSIVWNLPHFRILFLAPIFALVLPFVFIRTRNIRFDRFIGELSYGVYLTHFPILLALKPFFIGGSFLGVATASAAILAAICLFVFVDHPVDRWRQSRAARASKGSFSQALRQSG